MRAIWMTMVLAVFMFSTAAVQASAEPAYAKWGRLAMKETAQRYHADIIDYKHVGRNVEDGGLMTETFRLQLRKGAREFEVTVRIWFEQQSERVVRIHFSEDDRASGLPAAMVLI
ncbi:DUF3889 domain-containing protein [Paenibacillus sp. OV219]|uniref:DUF3889 domain-containing protein n=1 Tax=Paenibacillus sp. OV219 TaxID=1884377 RepID=UPI0008C3CF14|nr:DUF3889 domain-containing protein [Paenibacillus sp. OV219]SEN35638.1 Protein of unknown function [Paenibacillus sp. OV219]